MALRMSYVKLRYVCLKSQIAGLQVDSFGYPKTGPPHSEHKISRHSGKIGGVFYENFYLFGF
jgi:hypothetical protein